MQAPNHLSFRVVRCIVCQLATCAHSTTARERSSTMNSQIFSFVKISDNSMVASVRIARFVSNTLGIPICWDETVQQNLKTLIIINGAYAFAGNEVLEALGKAIYSAQRVVWVQNDYTVIPPKDESGAESPFRKAFRDRFAEGKENCNYWTTCAPYARPGVAPTGHRCGPSSQYINWNALQMSDGIAAIPFESRQAPDSLVYYGSFRKDREKYFDRYFLNPRVTTIISCPNRKFDDRYHSTNIIHETKLGDLFEYLSNCGLGLYIEDKKSHNEFHSPANRFYEMLSAGLPMVFQPESQKTMDKGGYDISDWILWNAEEAPQLMERKQEIFDAQRLAFFERAKEEKSMLIGKLERAWEAIQ